MATSFTSWNPAQFLDENERGLRFSVVILNQPILLPPSLVMSLWKRAIQTILVDGGADRWLTFLQQNYPDVPLQLPDLITGDLDSVSPCTLQLFQEKGTPTVKTPDQNETDFTKALRQAAQLLEDKKCELDAVVVLVEAAGRLDHILSNLNTLFLVTNGPILTCPIYLLASNSISWLLPAGEHRIRVPKTLSHGHCGLVPLGEPCDRTTTLGLKWNLTNQRMQFGSLVSTCNVVSDPEEGIVTVTNSSPLLWTMEITQDVNWSLINS